MKSFIDILEQQEQIDKLIAAGYGDMINDLLMNESKVYTKKGRLNKCGACRILKCKPKQLEDALQACKDVLEN